MNTLYLVALEGTKVVAYCGMLQALDEADITNVAVDQEHREEESDRLCLEILWKEERNGELLPIHWKSEWETSLPEICTESWDFRRKESGKTFTKKPTEDAVIMWKR